MANEDGTCWIVFNGEVYNHRSLRPLLEAKGHRFRTVSDTEVILHAYEEFGPACVERLDGMFAFAIYDGRRQELFAARDRLRKKPFFYTVLDGVFHFASELPALARSPRWRGDLDLTALEGYLSLGYFIAPSTIYRDVHKLMPGHWLRVANGKVETRQYWDVQEFDTDGRSDQELLVEIDATLRQAVHDRLESEVPLGAFLSGGIDSGLVVSYMAESLGDRLVTASVGLGDAAHNELEAAGIVATHFHSQHHASEIQPELDDVIEPVTNHLGSRWRFVGDSDVARPRERARHVVVALTGDGGDETFAGHDFRYVPHAMEAAVRSVMPEALSPAAAWLGTAGRGRPDCRSRCASARSRKTWDAIRRPPTTRPRVPQAGGCAQFDGPDPSRDPLKSPVRAGHRALPALPVAQCRPARRYAI
jgi:asparagine synthase (glutamine-hydrolysing)